MPIVAVSDLILITAITVMVMVIGNGDRYPQYTRAGSTPVTFVIDRTNIPHLELMTLTTAGSS